MKKKLFYLIGLAGLVLLLAACGNDEVQPVDIKKQRTRVKYVIWRLLTINMLPRLF